MRRKPFTQSDIEERERWPEIQAGLRGPQAYAELGILTDAQRQSLVKLARVEPEQERPFIDSVTCAINSYRLRKRCHAQESPAAVAESMRQVIRMVASYARDMSTMPDYVIHELKPPLPTADWFERAEEKLRQKERWVKGHRLQRLTEALIMHAWDLQRTGAESSYLALNWQAMKRWLEEALIVSGEPPPGKNDQKAYFEQLMLPSAANGTVDLDGRLPAFDTLKSNY